MLQHTFCHVAGIGVRTERGLWEKGLRCWNDLAGAAGEGLAAARREKLRRGVEESQKQWEQGNAAYFGRAVPAVESWRLYGDYRQSVAYVDIETTGLDCWAGHQITTIALYDGHSVRHYIHGRNLDEFPRDVRDYRLLVTYNGKCFDVPFINRYFGIELDQAHIDLRYVLKSLGYSGGLKGCEKKAGLARNELEGVDGFFAVLLWQEYQKEHDQRVLETLLAYNVQDVLSLEQLMAMAFNLKVAQTPFEGELRLQKPMTAENPFRADRATIERLMRGYVSPWGR